MLTYASVAPLLQDFYEFKETYLKKNKGVYENFNEAQLKYLQKYIMLVMRMSYISLFKSTRLRSISPNKAKRLYDLAENINNWEFGGMYDLGGVLGNCALGHALRYAYIAVSKAKGKGKLYGNLSYCKPMVSEYLNSGLSVIVFGETCVGDFFDLDNNSVEKLKDLRLSVLEDIKWVKFLCDTNKLNTWLEKVQEPFARMYNAHKKELSSCYKLKYAVENDFPLRYEVLNSVSEFVNRNRELFFPEDVRMEKEEANKASLLFDRVKKSVEDSDAPESEKSRFMREVTASKNKRLQIIDIKDYVCGAFDSAGEAKYLLSIGYAGELSGYLFGSEGSLIAKVRGVVFADFLLNKGIVKTGYFKSREYPTFCSGMQEMGVMVREKYNVETGLNKWFKFNELKSYLNLNDKQDWCVCLNQGGKNSDLPPISNADLILILTFRELLKTGLISA